MGTKSLNELENSRTCIAPFATDLVSKCYSYRNLPIGELSIEQLRLLISQSIGLLYLVPLALQRLQVNPLVEGDLYEGDLLISVLRVGMMFWETNPDYKVKLIELLGLHRASLEQRQEIMEAITRFKER